MCNDYELHASWAGYCKLMQDLALRVARHHSANDLPRVDDIRINDVGPVMGAAGDEIELVTMSFSFPPGRSGGAPVFNFRSEGRHFANSTRCVVPASAFFEFTGKRYRRQSTGLHSRARPSGQSPLCRDRDRANSPCLLRC
jgi:putative SOS response-associated peptidase YedK